MVTLPNDVMLDICVRLPVKTIGRFRCVNKSWYKLLNDSKFVREHLYHATEMNKISIMLPFWDWENCLNDVYTKHYDLSSSTCTGSVHSNLPFALKENYPPNGNFDFLGYCNGLVCVDPYNMEFICLWNPSTNEYMQLPKTPLDIPITTSDNQDTYIIALECGFGYDYEIGEYKVVCLTRYGPDVLWSGVHLFTLGSNTWITLESIPYLIYGSSCLAPVPINGVIYWQAYRESKDRNRVILSFNFQKEIFEEIPRPDLLMSEECRTDMCVLGGSLCIYSLNCDIGVVGVWELKDCGVRKSWNKLFAIDFKKHFGLVYNFQPLQSLKDGEFLFGFETDVGYHVQQYDLNQESLRPLFIYENRRLCPSRTVVYVKSLVSLNSGSYLDNNNNDYGDAEGDDGDKVDDDSVENKK